MQLNKINRSLKNERHKIKGFNVIRLFGEMHTFTPTDILLETDLFYCNVISVNHACKTASKTLESVNI